MTAARDLLTLVLIGHDEERRVYYVAGGDIGNLQAEAETLEELRRRIHDLADGLIPGAGEFVLLGGDVSEEVPTFRFAWPKGVGPIMVGGRYVLARLDDARLAPDAGSGAMHFARALEIVAAICDRGLFLMGLADRCRPLSGVTLADMVSATRMVEASHG